MADKYKIFIDLVETVTSPLKKINTQFEKVRKLTNRSKKSFSGLTNELGNNSKAADKVKDSWKEIPTIMAGAFAIGGITSFGKEVVSTLGEFERYEAVLTNTLGSNSAAKKALEDITNFASQTPFQVNELSNSFVKLANQNFTPTMQEMTKLGDLASATGNTFDSLAEAVLDAKTMEFERLKEFGITASKNSKAGTVTFNFKNQDTEVKATDKAIQEYLLSLGELKGVQGASAAIMKTTEGQLSNLGDKYTQLKLQIGTALKPVIAFSIGQLADFVVMLQDLVVWVENNTWALKALGVFVGLVSYQFVLMKTRVLITKGVMIAYKAVVIALNGVLALGRLALLAFHGVLILLNGGLALARVAMIAFNVAFLSNPIGLVILAVAALIGGLALLAKKFPSIGAGLKSFFDGVVFYFTKAKDFVYNTFIAPVVKGINMVKGLLGFEEEKANGGAGAGGAAQGIKALQATVPPIKPKMAGDPLQNTGAWGGLAQAQMYNAIDRNPKAKIPPVELKVKTGANKAENQANNKNTTSITGGNGSGGDRNITINSLVKELHIHTNTFSESPARIKAIIEGLLLEVTNNLNHGT